MSGLASQAARRIRLAGLTLAASVAMSGCGASTGSRPSNTTEPARTLTEAGTSTAQATTSPAPSGDAQTSPGVPASSTDAPGRPPVVSVTVRATVETAPVPHGDDAADDPAIWVDPITPSRSVIIGTDKGGGIGVYDIAGRQLQYLADGEMNNIDLRTFRVGGRPVTLVGATDRSNDTLALYRLDPARRRLAAASARPIAAGMHVYGMCMYRSPRLEATFAFVGGEDDGVFQQWRITPAGAGRFDARRVRTIQVGSKAEGCVADDATGALYIAEEDVGLWRYRADPNGGDQRVQVDRVGGGHLTADVEGVAVVAERGGQGMLVASSQGSNTFAVYRRQPPNNYLGTFAIVDGPIDGVQDTDGVDVTTASLGPAFPGGVLVVQDGDNGSENQNFKLVPWTEVIK
jgi:myo-inositol-hexaphosphate 3-phosphohydrolase